VVGALGFNYVEASTDNEIDALYSDESYMGDWADEVRAGYEETGVQIANFYTGYQTYRTIGLAHHDARMRRRIVEGWLKRMVDFAEQFDAGLGVYLHALSAEVLQDPAKYAAVTEMVIDQVREVAAYGKDRVQFSIEQMYSPHQTPWTIDGTIDFLRRVHQPTGDAAYVTIDLGHQIGQARFRRPSRETIAVAVDRAVAGSTPSDIWLGPERAYELLDAVAGTAVSPTEREVLVDEIASLTARYPYLFAEKRDSYPYAWIEAVGRYSPIMHLQQTDGVKAGHRGFTPETNRDGIIKPDKVLAAYAKSFAASAEEGMPPPVENLYLSFEVFASNTESNREVLHKLQQSHDYWRQYIPEDGMLLGDLAAVAS